MLIRVILTTHRAFFCCAMDCGWEKPKKPAATKRHKKHPEQNNLHGLPVSPVFLLSCSSSLFLFSSLSILAYVPPPTSPDTHHHSCSLLMSLSITQSVWFMLSWPSLSAALTFTWVKSNGSYAVNVTVKWFKNNVLAVISIHSFSSLPLSSPHTPTDLQLPSSDPALVLVVCHLLITSLVN